MPAPARRSLLTPVLLVIILVMGGEIVYLISQNRRLQTMLADVPSLQVLQQGQTVPSLTATDLDGDNVSVRYGPNEPSTLLIWFSPTCHICAENAEFWNDIYRRYHGSPEVRFLGMSDAGADDTRAYVADRQLAFPVICVTDASLVDVYNGHVMPQTALISPRGAIEKVWPGALEPGRRDEIGAVLDSLTMVPQTSERR